MNHNLFKPANIDDGKHAVVGNCNGISAEERWETETPLFAKAILSNLHGNTILDYGCGIGRITKELITQNNSVEITGVDASQDMLQLATDYISDNRFTAMFPQDIPKDIKNDFAITGVSHILAISGYNITLISLVVMWFLLFFMRRRLERLGRVAEILAAEVETGE